MTEVIYIARNPGFPDYIKIGKTTNLEDRIRFLSSHTGVPFPFEVIFACEVKDDENVEGVLHDAFGDHRINPKREFFKVNPERVIPILKLVQIRDVTPNSDDLVEDEEDRKAFNKERNRMPPFNFSLVEIPVGSVLSFVRDENITATVADNRNIYFEDEKTTLSQAAKTVLNREYNLNWEAARGPDFWVFEGETLSELRMKLEDEN